MSTRSRFRIASGALVATLLVGCDPSTPKTGSVGGPATGDATLMKVEFGRLVDIYAYRRVDPAIGDRRDSFNRTPVLVRREVVVNPAIETQQLYDSVGEENIGADFRFRPFDIRAGHEELLILHDDRVHNDGRFEHVKFQDALDRALSNLVEVAASYRDQDTRIRPMPVVPRNAALVLTFDRDLDADLSFFAANPSAVQVLQIQGDPKLLNPPDALFELPFRIMPRGNQLVVDTTILGDERGTGGLSTAGLPSSNDTSTANIRLAIPTRGGVSQRLRVEEDRVPQLNDIDSFGRDSLIRDFRSGNPNDGRVGALIDVERPMIVGDFEMGIIGINTQTRVLTINKRAKLVAVRGRMPYVDGPIDGTTGLPKGPASVPTVVPLRSGDILTQEVTSPITGEVVRLRAEILENLAVGTFENDTQLPVLGRARDGTEAENDTILRVRVASLEGFDSEGNVVSFRSSNLPLGADCIVRTHYYENVPSASGGLPVTDNNPSAVGGSRRPYFLVVDPPPPPLDANRNPVPLGSKIDPLASLAVRLSEPMDLSSINPLGNFLLTNSTINDEDVATLIQEPKPAALSILDTQVMDLDGDGTLLALSPRLGHFHLGGAAEQYWLHMMVDAAAPTDLAQNPINLFDARLDPTGSFSIGYTLNEDTLDNLVGSRVFRFESADEDGTLPGSVDMFGQFSLQGGRLLAAPTTRFSATADSQNLGGILRYTRGECYDGMLGMTVIPAFHPGTLYQTPSMVGNYTNGIPPVFGGDGGMGRVIEPHQPRGSRLQMTYREEDFGLGQSEANLLALDIEQMYWAPYNDRPVLFDRFDRYSLSLGHANKRPDLRFFYDSTNQICNLDCASMNSGLSTNFANNVLQGTSLVPVVVDRAYEINPNDAFRAPGSGIKYIPYPEFERSYTWRDERLVEWDPILRIATGLGGAQEPLGLFPQQDVTTNLDSPWGFNRPPAGYDQSQYAYDEGDFWGIRTRDHHPIALPLLMDFKVFPDNGTFPVAQGANAFHVALIGPTAFNVTANTRPAALATGDGYYNSVMFTGCPTPLPFPSMRVHRSGGFDQNTGQDILIDPESATVATSSWIKDAALGDPSLGLFLAPGGDDHLHWARADFVRKVSIITFGFFDTLTPNQHDLAGLTPPFSGWPGVNDSAGIPNFSALESTFGELRVSDLVASMDPPLTEQPSGTSAVVEFRGFDAFSGNNVSDNLRIYNPLADDTVGTRGNILNPNYACEAFRYNMPNSGPARDFPRVKVDGLTPYVQDDQLNRIRNRFGLLPRYLNFRLIFENNVNATPATNAALNGMAISYRMRPGN